MRGIEKRENGESCVIQTPFNPLFIPPNATETNLLLILLGVLVLPATPLQSPLVHGVGKFAVSSTSSFLELRFPKWRYQQLNSCTSTQFLTYLLQYHRNTSYPYPN